MPIPTCPRRGGDADRASPDWCFAQLDRTPRWGSTVRPQCPAGDSSWTWLQPLSLSCIFNTSRRLFQEHSPRTTDPAPIDPASYSITRYEAHARTTGKTAARLRLIHLRPRLPSPFATRPATARRHLPRSINSETTTSARSPFTWAHRCAYTGEAHNSPCNDSRYDPAG